MNDQLNDRILLSIPDVVALTGLGRTYIFELIRNGEIRSFKVGRRRVVHRDDLNKWIDGLRGDE